MAITDRITRWLNRSQAKTPVTTADERQMPASEGTSLHGLFAVERSRNGRVALSRQIYDEDPRMKGICETLARDVAGGKFQIEVEDEEAAQIAEDLRARLDMDDRLDDWCRLTFRDGDSFLEAGVTNDRQLAIVTRKPTLHMRRNSDSSDRFPDPLHAYWFAEQINQLQPYAKTLWFAEWQIIHVRWSHDEGERYGRPLMSSGHKVWKKIDQGEMNVAVRRATRSGMRYLHTVDGDEAAIEAYRQRNQTVLGNPNLAYADFFGNKGASVSAIGGDALVGSIDDIIHHIETWWIESPVPRGLLGYGRDLNRDVLGEQKAQYEETLGAVKDWAAQNILKPMFELQWLLAGKVPDLLNYQITWPQKQAVTPDDIVKISQAAQLMRGLGFPDEVINLVVARYLPGIEPDMLQTEPGEMGSDADRLAMIANVLGQASRGNGGTNGRAADGNGTNGNSNGRVPVAANANGGS